MKPSVISNEKTLPGEKCFLFSSGQKMFLNENRLLDKMLIEGENINPFLTSSLKQYITSKKDVFVDIGANHGFFSIYANFLAINPRVVAVEPSRRELLQFHRNLYLNNLKVSIREFGVGITKTKSELNLAPDSNPGANSFRHDWLPNSSQIQKQPAEIRPVQSIVSKHLWRRTKVIKVDTEGMETEILLNLPWKLLGDVVIVVEISPALINLQDIESIYRMMRKFRMIPEYGPRFEAEQYEEVFRKEDLKPLNFDASL